MKIAMVIVVLTCLALGLSAQSVNVLTPNGGENWAIGSDHTITWGSNNLSGNVKIGLFKGGTHLGNIVEHQNYQAGVSWHVGNPLLNGATYGAGTDYQIQVQSEVDWHWKDQSDTNFTISSPIVIGVGVIIPLVQIQTNPAASRTVIAPGIIIDSPGSSTQWIAGDTHEITWRWAGISRGDPNYPATVRILAYFAREGSVGSVLLGIVSEAAPNTGSFIWQIGPVTYPNTNTNTNGTIGGSVGIYYIVINAFFPPPQVTIVGKSAGFRILRRL
jgi:hypothetical protein